MKPLNVIKRILMKKYKMMINDEKCPSLFINLSQNVFHSHNDNKTHFFFSSQRHKTSYLSYYTFILFYC